MLVLRYLFNQLSDLLATRDQRLAFLPFMSPESIVIILTLYLLFVLKWGPKFMENRQPYNIERILLIYNGVQVVSNLSIVLYTIYGINYLHDRRVNWACEVLDWTESIKGMRSAQLSYCYYLLKILDLFDTVFFVLRKKTQQISFLHVYHHAAVLFGTYIGVQWAPGGQPWLFGVINCFVHFIMYGYYFGSVYAPELKTNIFIKKSITQLQIAQFVVAIIHMSLPLFDPDCGYSTKLLIFAISQNLIMLMLFSDFYYSAYIKPEKSKAKSS